MNVYNEIKGTLSCLSNLSSVTLGELKYLSLKKTDREIGFCSGTNTSYCDWENMLKISLGAGENCEKLDEYKPLFDTITFKLMHTSINAERCTL